MRPQNNIPWCPGYFLLGRVDIQLPGTAKMHFIVRAADTVIRNAMLATTKRT